MSKYAAVNVKFGADISQFSTAMQNAAREMKKAGDQLQSVGRTMTMSLTAPILALGAAALYSFGEIDSLKRGLISFSGSANLAEDEFNKLREVAKLPGIGLDEAVRGSINLQAIGVSADEARKDMMAFGNAIATIGGGKENFDLAIRGFGQLTNASKPLQQDLYQIANQLPQINKILKDTFGTNRAEDLAAMGITGKQLADILVNELGKLPKVSGGIKNAFENMSDTIKISLASAGEALEKNFNISGKLNAFAEWVTSLVERFKALSPEMQKGIIAIAGIAAAAGPVLLAFGTILKILPLLTTGFAALGAAAPYLLAIGAAGVLIYQNWDAIKGVLVDTYNYFVDLYNTSLLFRTYMQGVFTGFKNVWSVLSIAFQLAKDNVKAFGSVVMNIFSTIGKVFKAIMTGDFSAIPNIIGESMKKFADTWFGAANNMVDKSIDLGKAIGKNFADGFNNATSDVKLSHLTLDKPTGTTDDKKGTGGKSIAQEAKKIYDDIIIAKKDYVNALELIGNKEIEVLKSANEGVIGVLKSGRENFKFYFNQSATAIKEGLDNLNYQISATIKGGLGNTIADVFSQIGENIGMNEDPFANVGKVLMNSLGKMISTIGQAFMTFGLGLLLADIAIKSLNPVAAIAAGAIMVGAGAAISSAASKGIKGGQGGGGYTSTGGGYGSDYENMTLTTRLSGTDLVLSGQRTQYIGRR